RLRPVEFDWRRNEFPKRGFSDRHQVGLIAQEVEKVVPEVVFKDADGYYAIDYSKLTPLLIEAVSELSNKLDDDRCESEAKDRQLSEKNEQLLDMKERLSRLEGVVRELVNARKESRP